jgi:hypothetical protein
MLADIIFAAPLDPGFPFWLAGYHRVYIRASDFQYLLIFFFPSGLRRPRKGPARPPPDTGRPGSASFQAIIHTPGIGCGQPESPVFSLAIRRAGCQADASARGGANALHRSSRSQSRAVPVYHSPVSNPRSTSPHTGKPTRRNTASPTRRFRRALEMLCFPGLSGCRGGE